MKQIKEKGITLIALVITIIVLLILARSSDKHISRRQWNNRKSCKSKRRNRKCANKRKKGLREFNARSPNRNNCRTSRR